MFGWKTEHWTDKGGSIYTTRRHKRTGKIQAKHNGLMGDGRWHNLDKARPWERETILEHYNAFALADSGEERTVENKG